jgi:hypothetical protein
MCITKIRWGGGGVYLGGEFGGGETELWWPDQEITEGGGANGERGRRRKKEGRGGRKGSDESLCHTVTQGHQHSWCPPVHRGAARVATSTL